MAKRLYKNGKSVKARRAKGKLSSNYVPEHARLKNRTKKRRILSKASSRDYYKYLPSNIPEDAVGLRNYYKEKAIKIAKKEMSKRKNKIRRQKRKQKKQKKKERIKAKKRSRIMISRKELSDYFAGMEEKSYIVKLRKAEKDVKEAIKTKNKKLYNSAKKEIRRLKIIIKKEYRKNEGVSLKMNVGADTCRLKLMRQVKTLDSCNKSGNILKEILKSDRRRNVIIKKIKEESERLNGVQKPDAATKNAARCFKSIHNGLFGGVCAKAKYMNRRRMKK